MSDQDETKNPKVSTKAKLNGRIEMKTKQLGNSDLSITRVGFGAWAIGGSGWEFGWGDQDDKASVAAIHRALELGINWIDTAAVYGMGHSEEVAAFALKTWRGPRPYVFTKCGLRWDEQGRVHGNLNADSIRRECEDSLRRLNTDVIDLYQIPQAIAPISSLQPPYSLVRREVEQKLLSYCRAHEIGVIVYSPMASGLLTGAMTRERAAKLPESDWRSRDPEFREPKLSQNLALVERLREVGERHGRPPGQVAIAWALRNPAVTGAIVGARNAKQVEGNVGAAELQLSEEEVAKIEGKNDKKRDPVTAVANS